MSRRKPHRMHITFFSSEVSPYAKTGGLADVAGSLPKAIKKQNCDIIVVMPYYSSVRPYEGQLERIQGEYVYEEGAAKHVVTFLKGTLGKTQIPVYFIECAELFQRRALYVKEDGKDYDDNLIRFSVFCHASLALHDLIGFQPDVLHCNDWQTGLIPALVKLKPEEYPQFQDALTVMTIHNLSFQGLFPEADFPYTKLPKTCFNIDGVEYYEKLSTLKAGVLYSDVVTTVSRQYAQEIQTQDHGNGFHEILKRRRDSLTGILNGVDTSVWSPEKDKNIAATYSAQDLSGKRECKRALLRKFNLDMGFDGPVLGIVSRLTEQKGFTLLKEIAEELLALDVKLIALGIGDKELETYLSNLRNAHSDKMGVFIGYDERLAHEIEAGADIYLMPSRFEPSGLNQMYSLIYGTIPVVHATGGLDDTITNYSRVTGEGNGFKFREHNAAAFREKVLEAIDLYNDDPQAWKALMERNMLQDYSWKSSAKDYISLYRTALRRRKKETP